MDELKEGVPEALPFSPQKQAAICGWLVLNDQFFMHCRNRVKPEWFVDRHCGRIFREKVDFTAAHGRPPSIDELTSSESFRLDGPDETAKVRAKMTEVVYLTKVFGLDALSREMTKWLQARLYHEGITKSVRYYNSKHPEEAYRSGLEAFREIQAASFDRNYEVAFGDYRRDVEQQRVEVASALTFGSGVIDRLLLPEGGAGSLLPGDMSILMAPTNAGKCLGKDTPVMMADGRITVVQDVRPGDQLMGPDGQPRNVLSTTRGHGRLFRIVPKSGGDPWVCNDVHVLSLKATGRRRRL